MTTWWLLIQSCELAECKVIETFVLKCLYFALSEFVSIHLTRAIKCTLGSDFTSKLVN